MFNRSGKGNYAYTVTRVKAKKSLLLKSEDYDKMLQMSVPEISRYISEAGYQKEMADLAGNLQGIDLVEYATYSNMARVFSSILGASQGELYTMVSAYLEKWDIWNLKVILRGKSYGLGAEEIKEDLVPAGILKSEDLDKLIAIENPEDIFAAYSKAVHVTILSSEIMSEYKATGNLGVVEDYLDKTHYVRLLKSISPTSRPTKMFQDYVRGEIDIRNLETILKLNVEGIHGEAAMKYFIEGGREIDERLATQLSNEESISGIASDISSLRIYDSIKELMEDPSPSVRDVCLQMKKYEIASAKKFAHMYPLSVVPILDFMIHKELEVGNIRTVARGIESGLDTETIKGLLVI